MCKLIESALIIPRLRLTLEQLFQTSNQITYIGLIHHSAEPLTRCMGNRMNQCIDDLGAVLRVIEPKKIDTTSLTLEDALILEGYQEIRRGLVKSWQFIESRELDIIRHGRSGQ